MTGPATLARAVPTTLDELIELANLATVTACDRCGVSAHDPHLTPIARAAHAVVTTAASTVGLCQHHYDAHAPALTAAVADPSSAIAVVVALPHRPVGDDA